MRRFAILLILAICAVFPGATHSQEQPALTSPQPIAAPLQPFVIEARVPGYSGTATLLLFDSHGRFVGATDGMLSNGSGSITITPRGAPGAQWAALYIDGREITVNPALFTLQARTEIWTGQPRFDAFVPAARDLLAQDVLAYPDGQLSYRGYRSGDSPLIWLRDHVYQQRGFRYFDGDLRGTLTAFRNLQAPDGSFPDFLPRPFVAPQAFRTPVEADVEYLFVQGVYEAWQASSDDTILRENLEAMRRALTYTLQSPLRWDADRGLVKRPFTIDTWDFEIGPTTTDPIHGTPAPRHWIDERTDWGIFHGDNTGMAQALGMLARIEDRVGDPGFAALWRGLSAGIMANLNKVNWNGNFYRHHVPFIPRKLAGVDEARQLSLSNALALNRGVLSATQGQAILDEYLRRNARGGAFAEWYSIDPPFPPGSIGLAGRSGEIPGDYINGGIMPFVGGELARGAFRYGNETYGFAILDHYWQRMLSRGRSFLWYRPDGAEGVGSDQTIATDGWGVASMLCGLIEGAAGIEDNAAAFRSITVSPRWSATSDVRNAYVAAQYPASDGYAAYTWSQAGRSITFQLSSSADQAHLRLLLPPEAGTGKRSRLSVSLNGNPVDFSIEQIRRSRYVILDTSSPIVNVQVSW